MLPVSVVSLNSEKKVSLPSILVESIAIIDRVTHLGELEPPLTFATTRGRPVTDKGVAPKRPSQRWHFICVSKAARVHWRLLPRVAT